MSQHSFDNEELDGYIKIDKYNTEKVDRIAAHYTDILECLGEDPKREGLVKTPERVAKALQFLTHGYDIDAAVSTICYLSLVKPISRIFPMVI